MKCNWVAEETIMYEDNRGSFLSWQHPLHILETTKISRWEYAMLSEAQLKKNALAPSQKKTSAHPPNSFWLFGTRYQAAQSPSSLFSVGVKDKKKLSCQQAT